MFLLLFVGLCAFGRPPARPLAPSILETEVASHTRRTVLLPGPDGSVGYRIGLLVPRGPTPADGWPVVYLLDGRAALEHLDAPFLAAHTDHVLVTVAHDVEQRFALDERTRDYTPPVVDGPDEDPMGRAGGGASAFFTLLKDQVVPGAEQGVQIDPTRRALWGHSYGGLFVLFAAAREDSPFTRYHSASPSLWWDHGRFLQSLNTRAGRWPHRHLELLVGSAEASPPPGHRTGASARMVAMREALPDDALQRLGETLAQHGVPARVEVLTGLDHGAMFRASLVRALESTAAPED